MATKKTNPYIGWDKDATGKREGTEKLLWLCQRRWKADNWGTWVVRPMRGSKNPSVHGTGRALDIFIADKDHKQEAVDWFTRPDVVATLGIQEVHVYRCKESRFGKGWRIGRGWRIWDAKNNGGTPGAAHIHLEIDNSLCDDGEAMVKAWKSLPRF
jgi:hypothetical protein